MSRMNVVIAVALTLSVALATRVPVSMIDFSFQPDTARANAGDSVVWTNNGSHTHTTTSGLSGVPDGLWDSGPLSHGATFTRAFPAGGTFDYYCQFHYASGMTGAVVVAGSGFGAAPGTLKVRTGLTSDPNPFRAATTLRLATAGLGSVRIFSASGQLVRSLEPGSAKSIVWDGTNGRGKETGPGVYFCEYGSRVLAVTRLR
jgi:plastocyanin